MTLLQKNWTAEIFLTALVAFYMAAAWVICHAAGAGAYFSPLMYFDAGTLFGLIMLKAYFFYYVLRLYILVIREKPADKKAFIKGDLFKGPLNRERWRRAIPVFFIMLPMLSVFSSMKVAIPHLNPFEWDETLMKTDRFIHFGKDPWQWLQPLLGYPLLTYAVNLVYNLWLLVLFVVLYWQLFSRRDPHSRMQFFIAFVLAWAIIGNLLATVFSSAGPCFLERLTGNDHYRPLMDYLAVANAKFDIMALGTQDDLWAGYKNDKIPLGGGISAMPSVHVATAMLYLFLAWRRENKALKIISAVFFVFIVVGAIHLGWHYAVDGYLAILITPALWSIAGKVLDSLKNSVPASEVPG